MIEHLDNPQKFLQECKKILSSDGLLIITMPNHIHKFFYFFLTLLCFKKPKVHGVSSNHIKEFITFYPKTWETMFNNEGFKIIRRINLPFYFGHANKFIPLIKIGNKFHLSASVCYILGI